MTNSFPLLRSRLEGASDGDTAVCPCSSIEGSAFQKIMHRIRLVAATRYECDDIRRERHGQGAYRPLPTNTTKGKRAGKPFVAVDCSSSQRTCAVGILRTRQGERLQVQTAHQERRYFHGKRKVARCFTWTEVGNLALET